MNACERLEPVLRAYVSGDLATTECGDLLAHCRTCAGCRHLLELHRDLSDLGARAPEPSAADLDAVQARVLDQVMLRGVTPTPPFSRPGSAAGGWRKAAFGKRTLFAAAAVLAAALFASGLAVGRLPGAVPPVAAVGDPGGAGGELLQAMYADATSNRDLQDVADSRFTYSNVSFRPTGPDRVALDFDVTLHVQVEESRDSELVRDVLVHSLTSPESVGARLKALSYAEGALDPKLREALVFALVRDDSLAVRMKALTTLSAHLKDPRVEDALLATLRGDASVQMRLLALDYLAAERLDPERIRGAIRENKGPGDEALLVRLAEYDKQL